MPYTRHGHYVEKGPLAIKPVMTARCGGPALCSSCALDAQQGLPPGVTQEAPVINKDKIELVAKRLSDYFHGPTKFDENNNEVPTWNPGGVISEVWREQARIAARLYGFTVDGDV
jgi:hypothetical protein